MRIVLDIETNTTHDKIWCVVCRDIDKDVVSTFVQPVMLQDFINNCDIIVTHNGIFFDFLVLKKVWGIQVKKSQVVDTLVLSRLYNPSLEDGHSLAAWGNRLGFPKGDFTDFDGGLTDEMLQYCIQDTKVTAELYKHLTQEMENGFSKESITLEHEVAIIIAEQERNGFKLDMPKALCLLSELKTKLDIIQVEMETIFPPVVISGRTHKTSGKPLNDIITPFNPGSRQQIAERLQEKGWKPKKRTEKGSVIVDEEVLASLDYPEAKTLAEYMMLQKRIAQVDSWIKAVGTDSRVHGRVITNGAISGRATHMSPNMAQVPNMDAVYGKECRSLWTVDEGNALVGVDLAQLELRCLAHYMHDEDYYQETSMRKTGKRLVFPLEQKQSVLDSHFFTGRVAQRLVRFLIVQRKKDKQLLIGISKRCQNSKVFVTRLKGCLLKGRFRVLTVGDLIYAPHIRRSIHSYKAQELLSPSSGSSKSEKRCGGARYLIDLLHGYTMRYRLKPRNPTLKSLDKSVSKRQGLRGWF